MCWCVDVYMCVAAALSQSLKAVISKIHHALHASFDEQTLSRIVCVCVCAGHTHRVCLCVCSSKEPLGWGYRKRHNLHLS